MLFLKILLLPVSLLYGCAVFIRNKLYDKKILHVHEFALPVISVGNLTVGGTGKTPHIEYLIRLLKNNFKVATLSRGYGRKTKGYKEATIDSSSADVGDEPRQYKQKFPDITVTVCESRVEAIKFLMEDGRRKTEDGTSAINHQPSTIILLDDAFQHRAVKAGINILLIEYSEVFASNFLLPTGTLREWASGMKRADIIIITKCTAILSPIERRKMEKKINIQSHQKLFFSYIKYGDFVPLSGVQKPSMFTKEYYFSRSYSMLVFSGIANPVKLIDYLEEHKTKVIPLRFPDHHEYTRKDILKIQKLFDTIANKNKIIVTTEKDKMRLKNQDLEEAIKNLPIFYLPIETAFHDNDANLFEQLILDSIKRLERR